MYQWDVPTPYDILIISIYAKIYMNHMHPNNNILYIIVIESQCRQRS
jgi:hypothetical protein